MNSMGTLGATLSAMRKRPLSTSLGVFNPSPVTTWKAVSAPWLSSPRSVRSKAASTRRRKRSSFGSKT